VRTNDAQNIPISPNHSKTDTTILFVRLAAGCVAGVANVVVDAAIGLCSATVAGNTFRAKLARELTYAERDSKSHLPTIITECATFS